MRLSYTSLIFFAVLASATSAEEETHRKLEARRAVSVVCANKRTYSPSEVNSAVQRGCRYWLDGETVPKEWKAKSSQFPHLFQNQEGLPLKAAAEWWEFPILESIHGVYRGTWNDGSFTTLPPVFLRQHTARVAKFLLVIPLCHSPSSKQRSKNGSVNNDEYRRSWSRSRHFHHR